MLGAAYCMEVKGRRHRAVQTTKEEQDSGSVCTRGRSRARRENRRTSALCLEPTKQWKTQLSGQDAPPWPWLYPGVGRWWVEEKRLNHSEGRWLCTGDTREVCASAAEFVPEVPSAWSHFTAFCGEYNPPACIFRTPTLWGDEGLWQLCSCISPAGQFLQLSCQCHSQG